MTASHLFRVLGVFLVLVSTPASALHVAGEGTPVFAQPSGASGHGEPFNLDPGATAIPTVDIAVTEDPVSGWNLEVTVENFAFAPQRAGYPHVDGEGHAHLYINGEKIARLYGPWFHISHLPAGAMEVVVTLNTNDHRSVAVGGHLVYARRVVVVSEEQAARGGAHANH